MDDRKFSYIRRNAAQLVAIGLACDIVGTVLAILGAGDTAGALGGLVILVGAIALVTGVHHVVVNHTIQTIYLQQLVTQGWSEDTSS